MVYFFIKETCFFVQIGDFPEAVEVIADEEQQESDHEIEQETSSPLPTTSDAGDPDYEPPSTVAPRSRGRSRGTNRGNPTGRGRRRQVGSVSTQTSGRGRARTREDRPVSPVAKLKKQDFVPPNAPFDSPLPNPPEDADSKSPLDYFSIFIDTKTIDLLTEQTNLYARQKKPRTQCIQQRNQAVSWYFIIFRYCQFPPIQNVLENINQVPTSC